MLTALGRVFGRKTSLVPCFGSVVVGIFQLADSLEILRLSKPICISLTLLREQYIGSYNFDASLDGGLNYLAFCLRSPSCCRRWKKESASFFDSLFVAGSDAFNVISILAARFSVSTRMS